MKTWSGATHQQMRFKLDRNSAGDEWQRMTRIHVNPQQRRKKDWEESSEHDGVVSDHVVGRGSHFDFRRTSDLVWCVQVICFLQQQIEGEPSHLRFC